MTIRSLLLSLLLFSPIASSSGYYLGVKAVEVAEVTREELRYYFSPFWGVAIGHWRHQVSTDVNEGGYGEKNKIEFESVFSSKRQIKISDDSGLVGMSILNEIDYRIETRQWFGELTFSTFSKVDDFALGFELEADYLKKDELLLHEVEMEPTFYKDWFSVRARWRLELEAPIFRLYSGGQNRSDFAYEGFQVNSSVRFLMEGARKSALKVSVELPYEEEKKRWAVKFSLDLRRYF